MATNFQYIPTTTANAAVERAYRNGYPAGALAEARIIDARDGLTDEAYYARRFGRDTFAERFEAERDAENAARSDARRYAERHARGDI